MDNIPQLIPYLYIISGCINAIIAWIDLEQKLIRNYVFYKPLVLNKPLKNIPFVLWLALQIILPALFIWVTISNCTKPSTTIEYAQLGANILVYGVFFQVFSGITEKLGMSPINLIIPLTWGNILYKVYLNSTEGKSAREFWSNLEKELKKLKKRDLSEGLYYLENHYFAPPLYEKEECIKLQNRLSEIRQEKDPNSKCKRLVNQCFKGIIPRKDLLEVLEQFNLSPEELINKYFKQS